MLILPISFPDPSITSWPILLGSNNWGAAFEDVVHRIDRAIPELGLLTDRKPSISGFPNQPIWMARDMDQP